MTGAVLTPVAGLRLHALAARVPEMRPAEWRAFLADVARHRLARVATTGALTDAG